MALVLVAVHTLLTRAAFPDEPTAMRASSCQGSECAGPVPSPCDYCAGGWKSRCRACAEACSTSACWRDRQRQAQTELIGQPAHAVRLVKGSGRYNLTDAFGQDRFDQMGAVQRDMRRLDVNETSWSQWCAMELMCAHACTPDRLT